MLKCRRCLISNGGIDVETTEKFLDYVKKMQAYTEAIGLMYWDLRTGAKKYRQP